MGVMLAFMVSSVQAYVLRTAKLLPVLNIRGCASVVVIMASMETSVIHLVLTIAKQMHVTSSQEPASMGAAMGFMVQFATKHAQQHVVPLRVIKTAVTVSMDVKLACMELISAVRLVLLDAKVAVTLKLVLVSCVNQDFMVRIVKNCVNKTVSLVAIRLLDFVKMAAFQVSLARTVMRPARQLVSQRSVTSQQGIVLVVVAWGTTV